MYNIFIIIQLTIQLTEMEKKLFGIRLDTG